MGLLLIDRIKIDPRLLANKRIYTQLAVFFTVFCFSFLFTDRKYPKYVTFFAKLGCNFSLINFFVMRCFGYLLILLFSGLSFCSAQDVWKERINKEGILVYSKQTQGSKLNIIKVNCTVTASLSQFVALILDVDAGAEWLYSTKSSSLVKRVSAAELYYYSEIDFPWPAANRDFVGHLRVTQNKENKTVTIDAENVDSFVPEKQGVIRMLSSKGKWTLIKHENNQLLVEYVLKADPAGTLPSWITNLFDTKGPFETFKNLRKQLQKPVYVSAHLPFIVN